MHQPTNVTHKEIIDLENRGRGGGVEGLTASWKVRGQRSGRDHHNTKIPGDLGQTQLQTKKSGVVRGLAYGGRKRVAGIGVDLDSEEYDSHFPRGASSARCSSGRILKENLRFWVVNGVEEGGSRLQVHAPCLRHFKRSSGNNGRFLRE
ncbi:hypothetical protein AAHE18_01G203300 [Arachis hypogaea]